MAQKPHRLEVIIRTKTSAGVLLSEHIIRGDRVELISYYPSGQVMLGEYAPLVVSLEQYSDALEKYLSDLRGDGAGDNPYKE